MTMRKTMLDGLLAAIWAGILMGQIYTVILFSVLPVEFALIGAIASALFGGVTLWQIRKNGAFLWINRILEDER